MTCFHPRALLRLKTTTSSREIPFFHLPHFSLTNATNGRQTRTRNTKVCPVSWSLSYSHLPSSVLLYRPILSSSSGHTFLKLTKLRSCWPRGNTDSRRCSLRTCTSIELEWAKVEPGPVVSRYGNIYAPVLTYISLTLTRYPWLWPRIVHDFQKHKQEAMPTACVFLAPASPHSPGAETWGMQLQARRCPLASPPPVPLLGAPPTPMLRWQGPVGRLGSPSCFHTWHHFPASLSLECLPAPCLAARLKSNHHGQRERNILQICNSLKRWTCSNVSLLEGRKGGRHVQTVVWSTPVQFGSVSPH